MLMTARDEQESGRNLAILLPLPSLSARVQGAIKRRGCWESGGSARAALRSRSSQTSAGVSGNEVSGNGSPKQQLELIISPEEEEEAEGLRRCSESRFWIQSGINQLKPLPGGLQAAEVWRMPRRTGWSRPLRTLLFPAGPKRLGALLLRLSGRDTCAPLRLRLDGSTCESFFSWSSLHFAEFGADGSDTLRRSGCARAAVSGDGVKIQPQPAAHSNLNAREYRSFVSSQCWCFLGWTLTFPLVRGKQPRSGCRRLYRRRLPPGSQLLGSGSETLCALRRLRFRLLLRNPEPSRAEPSGHFALITRVRVRSGQRLCSHLQVHFVVSR